jgi:hypothetical protein
VPLLGASQHRPPLPCWCGRFPSMWWSPGSQAHWTSIVRATPHRRTLCQRRRHRHRPSPVSRQGRGTPKWVCPDPLLQLLLAARHLAADSVGSARPPSCSVPWPTWPRSSRRVRPLGWGQPAQTLLGQAEVPTGCVSLWAGQPVSTLGLVTLNHFPIFIYSIKYSRNC